MIRMIPTYRQATGGLERYGGQEVWCRELVSLGRVKLSTDANRNSETGGGATGSSSESKSSARLRDVRGSDLGLWRV